MSVLWTCTLVLVPVVSHGALSDLFRSDKEVATKFAVLHEDAQVFGLDFSPDGKQLAVTAGNKLQIWDWQQEKILHTITQPSTSAGLFSDPIRYAPDGRLVAVCYGRTAQNEYISVFDSATGGGVARIMDAGSFGSCNAIGFSADSKSLLVSISRGASAGDNLTAYRVDTGQRLWGLRTQPYPAPVAAFDRSYEWDWEPSPTQPNPKFGFVQFATDTLAISPDGAFLAMGGSTTFGPNVQNTVQVLIIELSKRAIIRTISAYPDVTQDRKSVV